MSHTKKVLAAKTLAAVVVGCGVVVAVTAAGCMKPYDTPEYVEVNTSETAFVVPLEEDAGAGVKFQSVDYLEKQKVAAKRIQVTHRWNQEGRLNSTGKWIPAVKVIKVDRAPVTREWTADKASGTSSQDQAIWVESDDSVGFSMGFTATGYIKEEDAAKFLYWYPSGSLAQVMDTEVRARIQQAVAAVAAAYPLDGLRSKKEEMVEAAREDVIPFFAERGITITTVSQFGGMTYENPEIQKAIDNVFIAQQEKAVNLAKFEAQQKANERIELEAKAMAEKARLAAKGEADAKITQAEAEAQALSKLSEAVKNAGPGVMVLRQIEIEQKRAERWDGKYPHYYMGTGGPGGPNLLLNIPAPDAAAVPSLAPKSTAAAK